MIENIHIQYNKQQDPILFINNKPLHSIMNPRLEKTFHFIQADQDNIIFILGSGLGYGVYTLVESLKKHSFQGQIVVLELNFSIANLFIQYGIHIDAPFYSYFYKHKNQTILEFVYGVWQKLISKKIVAFDIHFHPHFYRLYSQTYDQCKTMLEKEGKRILQNILTQNHFNALWIYNAVINHVDQSQSYDIHLQETVILIGAGVSLDSQKEFLHHIQSRIPIAAVDTALKTLSAFHIIPDLIFSADAQIHNYRDFFHLAPNIFDSSLLIYEQTVYQKIPALFKNKMMIQNINILNSFSNLFQSPNPKISGSISVTSLAIILLKQWGATKILLLGMDFGPSVITHTMGADISEYYFFQQQQFKPFLNFYLSCLKNPLARDIPYEQFIQWIQWFMKQHPHTLIQKDSLYPSSMIPQWENSQSLKGKIIITPKKNQTSISNKIRLYQQLKQEIMLLKQSHNFEELKRKIKTLTQTQDLWKDLLSNLLLYDQRKSPKKEDFLLLSAYRYIDRLESKISLILHIQ